MSQKRAYRISCPSCKQEMNVDLYESINVQAEPDLKQKLMANQLNGVTCAGCSFSFRVDKNLLYNDPGRRLLVFWVPVAEDREDEGEARFGELLREMSAALPDDLGAPEVHLAFTRTELVERIFLVEAGLNPRIVEYIKYQIYTRNGGRLDPARKILLFDAQDSTESHLCFVIQDAATRKFEAMLQYDRQTYRALDEMFSDGEKSADLLELFPGPHISARSALLRELRAESAAPAEDPPSAEP